MMPGYRRAIKPATNKFTIVPDHRESGNGKIPWTWLELDFPVQWINPATSKKWCLKTGDYSILDYQDKVALEHKSGIKELFTDLVVGYRPTFKRFLMRMSEMQVKAILVEEPLTAERVSKVVKKLQYDSKGRSKLTDATLWYWVAAIQVEYGIPIIFCDGQAVKRIAVEWLQQAFQQVR